MTAGIGTRLLAGRALDELPEEISDNEEIVENRDDEAEEGNDDIEEIAENPCDAEPNTSSNSEFFVAKDETKWNRTPIANQHQVAVRNIIRERSGPHRRMENLSISDTFKCFYQ
ncbi:hypothetical protein FQA39_LY12443 [Lamprigera yunnana]|nr:hypothetical protein FQA39_LY12443 [Lamprigera yunnana]